MIQIGRYLEASLALATMLLSINFMIMASDVTAFALGWAFLAAGSFVLMLVPGIVLMLIHPQLMSHPLFDERPALPLLALSAMLICGGLAMTDLPERVRFELSRDELEREVERTREEWRVAESAGRWIGWYNIKGVEFGGEGRLRFDLGGCGMLEQCWLVFERGAHPVQDPRELTRFTDRWWILRDPI